MINAYTIRSVSPIALARAYNVQNVATIAANGNNPYEGKTGAAPTKDPAQPKPPAGYIDVKTPLSPIITDLQLRCPDYTDYETGKRVSMKDLYFACVLISTVQPKIIVKTNILGRSGTVKEYIGSDDHQISISGIIFGDNGQHPADEVAAVKRMTNAPVALDVINPQLNNLGVFYMVVENVDWPQEMGRYSQQPFTISAISDYPVELFLT